MSLRRPDNDAVVSHQQQLAGEFTRAGLLPAGVTAARIRNCGFSGRLELVS
jgi:hypothetical protein